MNFLPAMGFYMRRHEQITAMARGMSSNPGAGLAIVAALVPVIKKYWPQYNKDGLLDDLLLTLQRTFLPEEVIIPDDSSKGSG